MNKEELIAEILKEINALESQTIEQLNKIATLKSRIEMIAALPPDRVIEKTVETVYINAPTSDNQKYSTPVPSPTLAEEPIVSNMTEQPSTIAQSAPSFQERIEKKSLEDINKLLSINDRFLFRRELFSNNDNAMTASIDEFNRHNSLEESTAYALEQMKWDKEDEIVKEFFCLLEKRYS